MKDKQTHSTNYTIINGRTTIFSLYGYFKYINCWNDYI